MAAQTYDARAVAKRVNATLAKRGVSSVIDAKRVRAHVRDTIPAYDDGSYTRHEYSAALAQRIHDALVSKYTGSARTTSASAGRAKPASTKRTTKPAKPASVAQSAPQTAPEAQS